jgi:hypothetical protein
MGPDGEGKDPWWIFKGVCQLHCGSVILQQSLPECNENKAYQLWRKSLWEKVDTTHKDLVLDHRPSAGAVMASASFRYLSSDLEVGLTNLLVE